MPKIKQTPKPRPKLVNRGPAGLLKKLPKGAAIRLEEVQAQKEVEVNKIAPALRKAGLVVKLDQLILDPANARLHP